MKRNGIILLAALAAALLIASCKSGDDPPDTPPPGGYQLTKGDTAITIPNNAVEFARQNFSRDAQLLREFQVATDPFYVTPVWQLPLGVWKLESYNNRQPYMVPPYFRDVMTIDSAEYYYQIGTYINQFGFGWKDTFDASGFLPDSAYAEHIWPMDPEATVGFDGQSAFVAQYRGMWRFD